MSKSNIRLQKEKDELSAVVEFIKNKLTEFSSTEPVPTAEEGSSGGAGEDGLINQLTNLINHNMDLMRKVSDSEEELNKMKIQITTLKAIGRQFRERSEHAMAEVNSLKAENKKLQEKNED